MSDLLLGFFSALAAFVICLLVVVLYRLTRSNVDRLFDHTNAGATEGDARNFRLHPQRTKSDSY